MGDNFHTPYTSGTTFKAASLNPPLAELDKAITYGKNVIVHCDGTITYDKATGQLTWSDTLRILYNIENGNIVQNTIAASNVTVNDNEFAYCDLSETNNQVISISTAAITTGAASNTITVNRLVLAYRNSGSDELFPVYLRPIWGAAGSHAQLHDIDSMADHNGIGGGVENNLISFNANALPKDSGIASSDVSDAVTKKHDRDHDIDSTDDHNGVGGAIENDLISFDANGLPKDSGLLTSDVSDAVTKKHVRDHSIDSTDDHDGVGGATENNLISFDANGLPKDSGVASSNVEIYDCGCTYAGQPAAGANVLRLPMVRSIDFPANLTGSQGVIGTAATAQSDFDILKNDVSFGTMRFAAAGTTATFISGAGASFSAGDVLTVTAPNPQDATLSDLGFILKGTR